MNSYISQLEGFVEHVTVLMEKDSCPIHNPAWKQVITEVEGFIFKHRGTSLEEELLKYPRFAEIARVLRSGFYRYELACEHESHEHLHTILCSCDVEDTSMNDVLRSFPPVARTFDYASRELASLAHKSAFIHVGSGPCPESVLGVLQHVTVHELDCSICALDRDPAAMEKARTLFEASNVADIVDMKVSAAELVDYSLYSHILVAVMVRPEVEVVRKICETACHDHVVEVLIRTVDGLGQLVYEAHSKESEKLLEDAGFVFSHEIRGHTIMKTRIYRRSV